MRIESFSKAWRAARLSALLLLVASASCASWRSGTRPQDMSVEAHREQAERHAKKEREQRKRYDPDAVARAYPGNTAGPFGSEAYGAGYDYRRNDYHWGAESYNPTRRHLEKARKHEQHAQQHLTAARALESYVEAQCASFPPEARVASPLLGQIESAEDTEDGVRVRLAAGTNVNAALAHIRCHLAFARSHEGVEIDSCPLYLPGVRVSRPGPGRELDLTVDSRGQLGELRARIRHHLVSAPAH